MTSPAASSSVIFSSARRTVETVIDFRRRFAAADRIGERQALGGVEGLALVLLQKLPDGFYGFCHVTSRLQYNRFSLLHTMYKKHRMTKIMRCH